MSTQPSVPVPLKQRLQDMRLRIVPAIVFCVAAIGLGILRKNNLAAPTLVGQAEPFEGHITSYKPGVIAALDVTRFQSVKAGDPVGQVLVTDPKILASSLAVIEAEIESLRVGLQPIAAQQRTAMDYSQLRLDWMRQRAQLAIAKVNLQLAETDLHRTEELYKDKIVAQRTYDQAKATQERFKNEVAEINRLVEEQGKSLNDLQITNLDLAKVNDSPLRAAIAVQEARLKLTEAELSPIVLRATLEPLMISMTIGNMKAMSRPARSEVAVSSVLEPSKRAVSSRSRTKARTTRMPVICSRSTRLMPSMRSCMTRKVGTMRETTSVRLSTRTGMPSTSSTTADP